MLSMLTNIIFIETLQYDPILKDNLFSFETNIYRESLHTTKLHYPGSLKSKRISVVDNAYYRDLIDGHFYWFLNKDNEFEVYLYQKEKLNMIYKFKWNEDKSLKFVLYEFNDRTELYINVNSNLKRHFTYYTKLKKAVNWGNLT